MSDTLTLGEALPKEMARVTGLIELYSDPMLKGAGSFAIIMMKQDLHKAAQAMAEGDIAMMIRAYNSLKEYDT